MDRSRLEDQDEVPMTPRSPADEDRERLLDVDIDKPSPAEGQDNLARNLINSELIRHSVRAESDVNRLCDGCAGRHLGGTSFAILLQLISC